MVESEWQVMLTKQAIKDLERLKEAGLAVKVKPYLFKLRVDPWFFPPSCEKLVGFSSPTYSRRINQQHRLVYQVNKAEKLVKVLRMWTHYE